MKTYAQVIDGLVTEVIPPFPTDDGSEVPLEDRYPAQFVTTCVDITSVSPQPARGWTYDGSSFTEPPPFAPTPEDTLAANTAERDARMDVATTAIAPLQDAVDLDEATDSETALLKQWKQYRVTVNRVDLTQVRPIWPTAPSSQQAVV